MKTLGGSVAAIAMMLSFEERMRGYSLEDGFRRPMRQRLHHTKPFESAADARRRKKKERQAKKKGRKERR